MPFAPISNSDYSIDTLPLYVRPQNLDDSPYKSGKIVKALVYRGGSSVRSRRTQTPDCQFYHVGDGIMFPEAFGDVLLLSLFSPPFPFVSLFSHLARTKLVRTKKIFLYFCNKKAPRQTAPLFFRGCCSPRRFSSCFDAFRRFTNTYFQSIDKWIYTYPVSARPLFGFKTLFIRLLLSDYFYIDLFSLLFV